MTPLDAFRDAVARSLYLVELYELLRNRRQRRVRSDWASSFRDLMHWNQSDSLERVDGNDCVLVLKNPTQWKMAHFEHAHLAELLRAALNCGVSAMDRYFHDVIGNSVLKLLQKPRSDWPKKLANFAISLGDSESAIAHALKSRQQPGKATRPRTILKSRFVDALHKRTFQSSVEVEQAFHLLGIRKAWGKLARRMSGDADTLSGQLDRIVRRRNQIVHEGDVARSARPRRVNLNDISANETRENVEWIKSLVEAADRVVGDEL